MDVFEAVRTILAVRRYQDRPVPEDVLGRIVEAGRLTASSMNMQPWHFIVVQDRDMLRQLGAPGADRAVHRTGTAGDRGGDRQDPVRRLRREPRHPVHGADGVGRGGGL